MKLQILTLLCLLVVFRIEGQAAKRNVALLVVECEASSATCGTQHLVRYRFRDGEQVSRDIVFTTLVERVRFDLGLNHIYRNRYVITEGADIIDLRTGKLLHDGIGNYVRADGSRIINRVNRIDVTGFFYYDLKSNRYACLRENQWEELTGLLSPDQTKSVSLEGWGDSEIWLHTLRSKKRLLGSGFRSSVSEICCSLPQPPVLWLDNDRILTQRSNGELVILRLTGIVEPLVTFSEKEPRNSLPRLYRNPEGRIIYDCGDGAYVLDVENKKFQPYEWESVGNGFEKEMRWDPTYGQIVRFNGQEIGRWWAGSAKTTNGFVALEYGDVGSNLGYPKGVKVWNSISKKWVTLDAKWTERIIGWMEE